MTLTNLSLGENYDIESIFADSKVKAVNGEILTDKMGAHNTFDDPDAVHCVDAADVIKASIDGDKVKFTIPACSVLHLRVELA